MVGLVHSKLVALPHVYVLRRRFSLVHTYTYIHIYMQRAFSLAAAEVCTAGAGGGGAHLSTCPVGRLAGWGRGLIRIDFSA